MSKRRIPDLSSRLNATRCPPASSTATVNGAQFVSRPFLSATSTMVEACASVMDIFLSLLSRPSGARAGIHNHDLHDRDPGFAAARHPGMTTFGDHFFDQYTECVAASLPPRPADADSSMQARV